MNTVKQSKKVKPTFSLEELASIKMKGKDDDSVDSEFSEIWTILEEPLKELTSVYKVFQKKKCKIFSS